MWKNVYKRKRLTTWTYANDMKINIGEKIILCLYFIIVHTNTNTHSRQTAYHPFFLHSVKKAQNIFPCIQLNRSILTNFMLQRCYSCALCVCVCELMIMFWSIVKPQIHSAWGVFLSPDGYFVILKWVCSRSALFLDYKYSKISHTQSHIRLPFQFLPPNRWISGPLCEAPWENLSIQLQQLKGNGMKKKIENNISFIFIYLFLPMN